MSIIFAWYRLALRLFMMNGQAIQNHATIQMKIPGLRGMRARSIVESAELLEIEELDEVVSQLGAQLQSRGVTASQQPQYSPTEAASSETETPSEWTRVSSPEQAREATLWQIPQGLDLRTAPHCQCRMRSKLYTSMTKKNYQRLFWRCPRK